MISQPSINLHENVQFFSGRNKYPDCVLSNTAGKMLYPIKERIMSLMSAPVESYAEDSLKKRACRRVESEPVFFFIYNTDNYFHFLYDTLPYLLSYEKIRQKFPETKLLMEKSALQSYMFVEDLLSMMGIDTKIEVKIVEEDVLYSKLWVADSYTHGRQQDDPPHDCIYDLYARLKESAPEKSKETPKKIYVSRRSWVHGDISNIGTNYTSRRRLVNEDDIVDFLNSKGYEEVFAEKMSMIEKINVFSNATHIAGAIGGGLANCLFSSGSSLLTLVSPTFLQVNGRFTHCFKNVNVEYFNHTSHVDKGPFKRYMRVCSGEIVGEIEEVYEDKVLVCYSKESVAGWNSEKKYEQIVLEKDKCRTLDFGLNSPWIADIDKLAMVVK
jgi:hypothetical protein